MGGVPFSPKYKTITQKIELWEAVRKKKTGVVYSMSKLQRLESSTGIQNSMHCTKETAEEHLYKAREEYIQFKKEAKQSHKTFLWDLAEAVGKQSDVKKSTVYKQILHREEQRETSRRIKFILGKNVKGGIKRVEVINADGETVELLSKSEIEQACLQENERKYRQTESTPCMLNPLRTLLGSFGNTEYCSSILDGSFEPIPHMSPYTIEFFQELKQQHPTLQEDFLSITEGEYSDDGVK